LAFESRDADTDGENRMKKIALLFAGQGAQAVGMGRDLAEQFPTAADLFQKADGVLERKLSEIAWNGPIEDLTKTSNCQPALFVQKDAAIHSYRRLSFKKIFQGGKSGFTGMHALHGLRQLHLIYDKDHIGGGACHGNKITERHLSRFIDK